MNRIIVGLTTVLILAAAAFAGEMKSDPANYYLDPEEIRPYVSEELKSFLPSWIGIGNAFTHITELDPRLVEGQIPLYTVEGDLAAYIYIVYIIPGPLPTLDDIVGNARAGMEVYADFNKPRLPGETFDLIGAFLEKYPYEETCVHAIVGVNEKWPYAEYCARIPTIILRRPAGEDAARNYYGSDGFEFVTYITGTLLQGYEFTYGQTDIIVPVDRFGTVDENLIKTRAEAEAHPELYTIEPKPEHVEFYFNNKWGYLLNINAGLNEMQSDPANYYLDPEEIRPIVRDSLEDVALISKEMGQRLRHIETFDVRLIDGQLPIYSVSGEVLAYIYIAYVVPGPLPSFDDIINKRVEVSEAIKAFRKTPYEERGDYTEFYEARYPYEVSCAYAIIGVNPRFINRKEAAGTPNFIDCLPEAREVAAKHLGTDDFELTRILMWPGSAGYEFSDGNLDIVVPFDDWTGMVFKEKVLTREEMDREPHKYEIPLDEVKARKWMEHWEYQLRALKGGS